MKILVAGGLRVDFENGSAEEVCARALGRAIMSNSHVFGLWDGTKPHRRKFSSLNREILNSFRQQLPANPLQYRITGAALSPCGKRVNKKPEEVKKTLLELLKHKNDIELI